MKRTVASAVFGAAVTLLLSWWTGKLGPHWFDEILWLAWLAGSLASGNIHSPNEIVGWLALWLMLSAATYLLLVVGQWVLSLSGRTTEKRG